MNADVMSFSKLKKSEVKNDISYNAEVKSSETGTVDISDVKANVVAQE